MNASTPNSRVGEMAGAYPEEWLLGIPRRTANLSAADCTCANNCGSEPPRNQKAHGAPAASASTPTSSLPVSTPGSITFVGPSHASKAALVRCTAAGSLISAGK